MGWQWLHLLIHIKDTGDQLALGKYVYQLMKALTAAYWEVEGEPGGRGWGMADGTAIDRTRLRDGNIRELTFASSS